MATGSSCSAGTGEAALPPALTLQKRPFGLPLCPFSATVPSPGATGAAPGVPSCWAQEQLPGPQVWMRGTEKSLPGATQAAQPYVRWYILYPTCAVYSPTGATGSPARWKGLEAP